MAIDFSSLCDVSVSKQAAKLLQEAKSDLRSRVLEDGQLQLSARFTDRFHFVDQAVLTVKPDGSEVSAFRCGCRAYREKGAFCIHCAATLLQWQAQMADDEAPAEAPVDADAVGAPAAESAIAEPVSRPEAPASFPGKPTEAILRPQEIRLSAPSPEELGEGPAAPLHAESRLSELAAEPAPALPAYGTGEDAFDAPHIRDVSYAFSNRASVLYPGQAKPTIPYKRFQAVFGDTVQTQLRYPMLRTWRGSCYGFSASAALFAQPGNTVSIHDFRRTAIYPGQLRLSDRHPTWKLTLHEFIETMMLTQNGVKVNVIRKEESRQPLSVLLEVLCEDVAHFAETWDAPVVMDIWRNRRYDGGHTVFPYGIEHVSPTLSHVLIYDPNWPNEVRVCEVTRDRTGKYTGWRYRMGENSVYSSDTGGQLSVIPLHVIQSDWDECGALPAMAVIGTGCENLSISDLNDCEVARIENGELRAFRDDVVPVRPTDASAAAKALREFWLHAGSYRVRNRDKVNKHLDFYYAEQDQGVEVETDANIVVIESQPNQNIQVTLPPEEKKQDVQQDEEQPKEKLGFKMRFLRFAKNVAKNAVVKGLTSILIRGVTVGLGTVCGQLGLKFLLQGLTGSDVTAFEVNGVPTSVTPYLTGSVAEEQAPAVQNTVQPQVENTDEDENLLNN